MPSAQQDGPVRYNVSKLISNAAVRIAEAENHPLFRFDVEEIKKILFQQFHESRKVIGDFVVFADAALIFESIKSKTRNELIRSVKAPAQPVAKSNESSPSEVP